MDGPPIAQVGAYFFGGGLAFPPRTPSEPKVEILLTKISRGKPFDNSVTMHRHLYLFSNAKDTARHPPTLHSNKAFSSVEIGPIVLVHLFTCLASEVEWVT